MKVDIPVTSLYKMHYHDQIYPDLKFSFLFADQDKIKSSRSPIITTGIKLSIYIKQNWHVKLHEAMYSYSYIDKFYFYLYANFSLITYQLYRAMWVKKTEFKGKYKSIMKGTRKRHEIYAKIEAKSYHNFIICSLMRLKFGKIVHWNLLFIVRKRHKLKLSSWMWTSGPPEPRHFLGKLCNKQM